MDGNTIEVLLAKLHYEHSRAEDALRRNLIDAHMFWGRQFHATADLLKDLTGIEHRNRYAR